MFIENLEYPNQDSEPEDTVVGGLNVHLNSDFKKGPSFINVDRKNPKLHISDECMGTNYYLMLVQTVKLSMPKPLQQASN
jgi:hypothetical protein